MAAAAAHAGTGVLKASPKKIAFGDRPVGTETFRATTIVNRSRTDIQLLVTSNLPDDFGFGLMPGSTCPALTPATLHPGESCDAVVRYSPTEFFAGSEQRGSLTATATDEGGTVVEELIVAVTGRGVLPPLGDEPLVIEPQELAFGEQPFGSLTKKQVTLTNTSARTLAVTIEANVPDDFSPGQPESTCSLSFTVNILSPGQSCVHVIAFQPSETFPGLQTGELIISASDLFGTSLPPERVAISGTGVPPATG